MKYNAEIWGSHYWFFLHTVAHTYPVHPNEITKKKYYDLIHNFPLFIPDIEIGNHFDSLLNKYPLTPYLSCRESFQKWVHFIHNKINVLTNKDEISFWRANDLYDKRYLPKPVSLSERFRIKKEYITVFITLLLIFFIYIMYKE